MHRAQFQLEKRTLRIPLLLKRRFPLIIIIGASNGVGCIKNVGVLYVQMHQHSLHSWEIVRNIHADIGRLLAYELLLVCTNTEVDMAY